jgi:5-(carboxyamino)imidazole ribonucleotide synthase
MVGRCRARGAPVQTFLPNDPGTLAPSHGADVTPLRSGASIGILGTGQLGRMLALAAARLGFKAHIYGPEADAPAHQVADAHTVAGYDDAAMLAEFAGKVDVVTYEFENVPEETARILSASASVHPPAIALQVAQDRLIEKQHLEKLGIAVAPYRGINSAEELEQAISDGLAPGILKTRRFGYDGKGQVRIDTTTNASEAFAEIGNQPAILEGFVSFEREISVIAARSQNGAFVPFDVAENVHRNGILHTSTVPADIDPSIARQAAKMAQLLMDDLDYVGVLGLELFHCPGGQGTDQAAQTPLAPVLIANEFAPRVHNSGHWTMDACLICQFEQHIRAVAGWPLGNGKRHSDVIMTNLIGDEVHAASELAANHDTALHLYGKAEARPGRKMGHINKVALRADRDLDQNSDGNRAAVHRRSELSIRR